MVDYNNALKQSIEYFSGDEMAAEVFLGKYALTTPDGEILEPTPREMHKRLAAEFARIEKKYPNPLSEKKIFNYLDGFKYIIPQGSPMAGIGNPYQIMSLGNCYTIESPWDSYAGILKTDQEQAQLMKRRAGVGFDISNIRPRGALTANAAKSTDGIGLFMERFSNTCREVAQGGRRGALMQTISVHHPEIDTFINIKRDRKKVTGANISIRLTDEFMEAVKADKEYQQRWPVDDKKNPSVVKMASAKKVWDSIIDSAHDCAEPGLLFWDTCLKYTPSDAYTSRGMGSISCNPCSEILLSANDSCRLMVVNALSFVKDPFTKNAKLNLEKLIEASEVAQRLMDDLVDLELECIQKIIDKINSDPEPKEVKAIELNLWKKIYNSCENGRRTGLGITGIADALAAQGVRYGSPEAIEATKEIYKCLALGAYRSSVQMAAERGAFPLYEYKLEEKHPFINRIMDLDPKLRADWKKHGRRNIALTTTAPCGSISVLAQTSSGIEPVYSLSYTRRRKINPSDKNARVDFIDDSGDKWQEYIVHHDCFKKWMEATGKKKVEDSPYYKATAKEIDWEASVELQAAAQYFIDHAISKTCNLPADVSKEVVSNVYLKAYDSGCKGFTVYREGSRSGVLLDTSGGGSVGDSSDPSKFIENRAPKRPQDLPCDIYHMTVKAEKWNLFVGLYDGRPYEVFAGRADFVDIPKTRKSGIIKKNGHYNLHIGDGENEIIIKNLSTVFDNPTESAFTRTVSLALRHGAPIQYVVEQIEKGGDKDSDMFSLAKTLVRVLKNYIKDGTVVSSLKNCPQCGNKELAYQEGCISCISCGWSKCT